MIDTEILNSQTSIIDLAGQLSVLNRKSNVEAAGPCPLCGGDDRFVVQASRFLCRGCHPKWGDAIEFMQWAYKLDFVQACTTLKGETPLDRPYTEPRKPETHARSQAWNDPAWQSAAQAALDASCDCLWNSPFESTPGREYLDQRHISPDSMLAFDLGYAVTYHPALAANHPAIWMPWKRNKITAIQYRFFGDDIAKEHRFAQLKGGDRILFGAHLLDATKANTLVLVEGELNAVSIWQECYRTLPIDVVSFGPKDNIRNEYILNMARTVAKPYERLIIWADAKADSLTAKKALNADIALHSKEGMDANAMLQSDTLGDFLAKVDIHDRQLS